MGVTLLLVVKRLERGIKHLSYSSAEVKERAILLLILYAFMTDFPHLTDRPWAPPSILFNGCHITSGDKAAGAWY